MNLEDKVKEVVDNWMLNQNLFTALDVSNEIRKSLPWAKHREVRDVVRAYYNDMQTKGYGRTPIKVTLADGSVVEALLYHHLSDSWDLDTKYDDQQREAKKIKTSPNVPVVTGSVQISSPVPVQVSAPSVTVVNDPKKLWENLFGNSRLFP